jgi:hypothetical protein
VYQQDRSVDGEGTAVFRPQHCITKHVLGSKLIQKAQPFQAHEVFRRLRRTDWIHLPEKQFTAITGLLRADICAHQKSWIEKQC